MTEVIKIPIVSLYYMIYLMFEKWMNVGFAISLILVGICGIWSARRGKAIGSKLGIKIAILLGFIYTGILVWVVQYGGLVDCFYNRVLSAIYYLGSVIIVLQFSNRKWLQLNNIQMNVRVDDKTSIYRNVKYIIWGIYIISLIPVLAISPYVFARADDYSFGYRSYHAWNNTGSIITLLKAIFEMIKTAYFGWQGTYSSIFMMSLQPTVFDERLYAIVPMFFVLIITFSSYFIIKTIVVDLLRADRILCSICIGAYVLLVIQKIPVKQSAFFWYNGAIHYIGAHCVLLCMLAFIIRFCIGKQFWSNWLGAAICAVYMGGANHVTAVSTLLLVLTLFFGLSVTKTWKKYYSISLVALIYLVALSINLLAPGNFNKMGMHEGMSIVSAFVLAFKMSAQYILGEWMHWTVLLVSAVCVPMIWVIVRKTQFTFSHPLVFVGYSWCYMASMFFTPLFTLGHVNVGRFQNIMFLQAMLWILLDIGYVCGWLQRKYEFREDVSLCINEKKYLLSCLAIGVGMAGLSFIAEPEEYTSVHAAYTLLDENLYEYAEDYWYNIDVLQTQEREVVLRDLSNIPTILNPEECEVWYSGLRLFYDKDKIYFEE